MRGLIDSPPLPPVSDGPLADKEFTALPRTLSSSHSKNENLLYLYWVVS